MIGKADMLPAKNRTVSAFVVVCLVISAFAGILLGLSAAPRTHAASLGDLTINSGTYVIENIDQHVDGNVTVNTGAELIIRDATLSVISNYDPSQRHSITINGGTLTLDHGTVTTYLDQISPWPFLNLAVMNAGHLTATGNSVLMFPGNLALSGGAHVVLTNTAVVALPDSEINQYVVGSSGLITYDQANDGPTMSVVDSTLELYDSSIENLPEYGTLGLPASNLTLSGSSFLLAVNSYIGIDFGPAASAADWFTHNVMVLSGTSMAELYGCTLEPYGGVEADRAPAIVASVPTWTAAHVYRWLNVTVGDEYGVPIPDASVSATFTGSTLYEDVPSFYFVAGGATQALPPTQVLNYMGKDAGTFAITGPDGVAMIPYLTDLIRTPTTSDFIGSFSLTGSAVIGGTPYASTEAFSFPAYPAMSSEDRSFGVTVEITGVSAESPDQTRWLVVPPDLTIKDIQYYHAGDVIVAAGGTLTLDNALFELIQSYSNQRTIYVDGTLASPGRLVIQQSTLRSDLSMNLIVKGYAQLTVQDSVLEGINIIALENANITLTNSSVDMAINTAWDSQADIVVKDSNLAQAPILSGYSEGSFTNTSVPSIRVEDSAVAYIYRWIHVTVLDGANKPLPGAVVSAYYYVSDLLAGTAVSSASPGELGVAKVNSLGTKITALASTFVGNYYLDAVYTYGGTPYPAENTVAVSVMPYTTPLGRNATYVTMKIPGALPDLYVNQAANPVVFNNTSPMKGQSVGVTGTVSNVGVSVAYNVRVDFYDVEGFGPYTDGTLFASATIPMINPASTGTAQATWVAGGALAPTTHRIYIVVDLLNTVPEIVEDLAQGYGDIAVQNLPDLRVIAGPAGNREIYVNTLFPEVDGAVTLSAIVHNDGDLQASDLDVSFWADGVFLGTDTITVPPGSTSVASIPWTPHSVKVYTIAVSANPNWTMTELNYLNNNATVGIEVYNHPDLELTNIRMLPATEVSGGKLVKVWANLRNLNAVPFYEPSLKLEVTGEGIYLTPTTSLLADLTITAATGVVNASASFIAPTLLQRTTATVSLTINPDNFPMEASTTNNRVERTIIVRDSRADLAVFSDSISVKRGSDNITSEMFGRTVTISVEIENMGSTPVADFNMTVGIRGTGSNTYNATVHTVNHLNVSANSTDRFVKSSYSWSVSIVTAGSYEIWAFVDPWGVNEESNKTNNFASTSFTVNPLAIEAIVAPTETELKAGQLTIISATVTYTGDGSVVKNLPGIQFWLVDPVTDQVIPNSNSTIKQTDGEGTVTATMRVPSDMATGTYTIRLVVLPDIASINGQTQVHVSALGAKPLLPMWLWLVIIVAAIASVAGFMGWTYKYGLGRLVECGECGQFIPASSKRCPKCGVEFEVGTMKCSECGAWIPAESKECPNCGVKFVGEAEDEADYMERMKAQYESMVDKYRELAKMDLGKKFSDKAFDEWWRKQPGYITFDDWLAKEEQKKSEGPIACPNCGTLNPKEATVCHKCGTVFGAHKEAQRKAPPPEQGGGEAVEAPAEGQPVTPAAAPQRMVIRRPVDRKVVPKKIIKSPMGGTEGSTEGDQEQQ